MNIGKLVIPLRITSVDFVAHVESSYYFTSVYRLNSGNWMRVNERIILVLSLALGNVKIFPSYVFIA